MNAGVKQSQKVVADDPFHRVLVAETQPHPKAVELRTAKKSFSFRLEVGIKFADEIDALHIVRGDGLMFPVGGEQVDRFHAPKSRLVDVSTKGGAIEQYDHNALVRRGLPAGNAGRSLCFCRHDGSLPFSLMRIMKRELCCAGVAFEETLTYWNLVVD